MDNCGKWSLLPQPAKFWPFCSVFCSTCCNFIAEKRRRQADGDFTWSMLWGHHLLDRKYEGPSLLHHWLQGNVLAVTQLACFHPPAKLWLSPTAVCSPGEHKWIAPRVVSSRKMSRGDTLSQPALRYDALSQQCIQELNNCCQLLSNRSICIEIGSRFADGPVLTLLCISHAHE